MFSGYFLQGLMAWPSSEKTMTHTHTQTDTHTHRLLIRHTSCHTLYYYSGSFEQT